jgi:hypothetical protein
MFQIGKITQYHMMKEIHQGKNMIDFSGNMDENLLDITIPLNCVPFRVFFDLDSEEYVVVLREVIREYFLIFKGDAFKEEGIRGPFKVDSMIDDGMITILKATIEEGSKILILSIPETYFKSKAKLVTRTSSKETTSDLTLLWPKPEL